MGAWSKSSNNDCVWRITKGIALAIILVISALLMNQTLSHALYSWLAWISLLPLLAAIRCLPPIKAAMCGILWGGCLYLFCISNINPIVSDSLETCLLLIAVPGGYAALGSSITRRFGFSPMGLALGWIGVEAALQPLGLSYGLLSPLRGYGPFLHLVIDFLGYGVFAFLVTYTGAWLLLVLSLIYTIRIKRWPCFTLQKLVSKPGNDSLVFLQFLYHCTGYPRGPPDLNEFQLIVNICRRTYETGYVFE